MGTDTGTVAEAAVPASPGPSAVSRTARTGASILGWAGFAFAVGLAVVVLTVPVITNAFSLTVSSGSMSPELKTGSLVFVRPVNPRAVDVGDIITFLPRDSDKPTTHRVVQIDGDGPNRRFVTKGDANAGPDLEAVPDQAVLGRVWFQLRGVGTWKDRIASPLGLVTLALIGFGWLFGPDLRKRFHATQAAVPAVGGAGRVLARTEVLPAGVSISETE